MRAVGGLFLWLMLAPLYLAFLYQFRIAAFGLRVRPLEASSDELSFGVIVPAYNEERTMATGRHVVKLDAALSTGEFWKAYEIKPQKDYTFYVSERTGAALSSFAGVVVHAARVKVVVA